MKKVIFLLLIILFAAVSTQAQSFIFRRISPAIVNGDTSTVNQVNVLGILKNTGSSTQNFKLIRVYKSLPSGWQQTVCTYLNCYGDIDTIPPRGGGNYPLTASQIDTLHFSFYAPTVGTGVVVWRAYIDGTPNVYQQDTFTVHAGPVGITPISSIVKGYELQQNYPNPFNPSTTINFSIAKEANVRLAVYDIMGREVANLVNSKLTQGTYKFDFNADDYKLSSGMYIYKLMTNDFTMSKKMFLIK